MMQKRFLALIMTFVLAFAVTSAVFASGASGGSKHAGRLETKEEVVYATLEATGVPQNVYVVNLLEVAAAGEIVDYGNYTAVTNLTDTRDLTLENGEVCVDAPEGAFYYQGNLDSAALPWTISVLYRLDGEEISPPDLAGRDGHLQIQIQTRRNETLDLAFYDAYMLQISATMDGETCRDIKAEKGLVVNAGANKQVSFTIMPGSDGDVGLSADVTDFQMAGIEIAAIPFAMDIGLPDTASMVEEFTELTDAIRQLSDGVQEIKNGTEELHRGTEELREGSAVYKEGIQKIGAQSAGLQEASLSVQNGLDALAGSLNADALPLDMSALAELPGGLRQLEAGLREMKDSVGALTQIFSGAYDALEQAMDAIPQNSLTQEALGELMAANPGDETLQVLVSIYQAALTAKGTFDQVKGAFAATETSLPALAGGAGEMADTLEAVAAQMDAYLEKVQGIESLGLLAEGLSELSAQYHAFHRGVVAYTGGVAQLADSYRSVHSGIAGVGDGTAALSQGMTELGDGAGALAEAAGELPQQVEAQIDEWTAPYDTSDFTPISFVSPENDRVSAVQFVIKTQGIEKQEQPAIEEEKVEKETFWTRLLNLFS